MQLKSFRFCMAIGALALLGVAVYYFSKYLVVPRLLLANDGLALATNGVVSSLLESIRALWFCFASQALLIGLLYLLVIYKPHAVTREVIVLLGLMQLVEAVLLFTFTGSRMLALVLVAASLFVLLGAVLWPKKLPREMFAEPAPPGTAAVPGPDET